MTDQQIQDVGVLVCEAAQNLFKNCDAEDDFCIQHVGLTAVFGGTNRIIFEPVQGFYADKAYCTPKFLKAWRSIGGR